MQSKLSAAAIVCLATCSAAIGACGGGSDDAPQAAATAPTTLSAGQSITLAKGQTVSVPAGTTVTGSNGNTVVIQGHGNTVTTSAGAVVSVSPGATGPADDVVVAQ